MCIRDSSQILIISHSKTLATVLAALCKVRVQELTIRHGDTRLRGQENAKACYVFDDDEDDEQAPTLERTDA